MQTYSRSGYDVRQMFGSIAARYDLANSVLSLGIDSLWRRRLARAIDTPQHSLALDLCTGTGDLLPILARRFDKVCGADFCAPMLEQARRKLARRGVKNAELVQADALALPFEASTFDLVTVAFGVRNFENLERGLQQIQSVLKPNAQLLVLEFGMPSWKLWRWVYAAYSKLLLPAVGSAVTGDRAAYEYLSRTSTSFPFAGQFCELLESLGFRRAEFETLSGGIAYLYCAYK